MFVNIPFSLKRPGWREQRPAGSQKVRWESKGASSFFKHYPDICNQQIEYKCFSPNIFPSFLFWQGISGEGGSNLPIMRTIEAIKKSKGYRDALDAPSFSLGFDDVT